MNRICRWKARGEQEKHAEGRYDRAGKLNDEEMARPMEGTMGDKPFLPIEGAWEDRESAEGRRDEKEKSLQRKAR